MEMGFSLKQMRAAGFSLDDCRGAVQAEAWTGGDMGTEEGGAWAGTAAPPGQSAWVRCVDWEPCPIGALPAHLATPL